MTFLLPPPYKKGLGRHKKARKKSIDDPKNKNCISKVGQASSAQIASNLATVQGVAKMNMCPTPQKSQSGNKGGRSRKKPRADIEAPIEIQGGYTTAGHVLTQVYSNSCFKLYFLNVHLVN